MSIRCQVLEYSRATVKDGVIEGVKIIGTQSRNGRRYPRLVLSAAKHLYEGAGVFIFHPNGSEKRKGSRQLCDHFGSLSNIQERDGLFGDLLIKQSHPMAQFILENADGKQFGLSHNAVVEMDESKTVVTKIISVNSVDLVDNPATTQNLFEEEDMELKQVVDAFEERLGAFEEKIIGVLEAAKPAPPIEKPEKKRIAVLEKIEAVEGVEPTIGNSHGELLAVLHGYSLT
ncbi:MAG TPA: hypothetical protein VMX74_05075 [Pirellulales bacterium]|nr:hypothetical protein [Pirellulales bacterium]